MALNKKLSPIEEKSLLIDESKSDSERSRIMLQKYCQGVREFLLTDDNTYYRETSLKELESFALREVRNIYLLKFVRRLQDKNKVTPDDLEQLCHMLSTILVSLRSNVINLSKEMAMEMGNIVPTAAAADKKIPAKDKSVFNLLKTLPPDLINLVLADIPLEDVLNLRQAAITDDVKNVIKLADAHIQNILRKNPKNQDDDDNVDQLCCVLFSRFCFYSGLLAFDVRNSYLEGSSRFNITQSYLERNSFQKRSSFPKKNSFNVVNTSISIDLATPTHPFSFGNNNFYILQMRDISSITDWIPIEKKIPDIRIYHFDVRGVALDQMYSIREYSEDVVAFVTRMNPVDSQTLNISDLRQLKTHCYDTLRGEVNKAFKILKYITQKQSMPTLEIVASMTMNLNNSMRLLMKPFILTGDKFKDDELISFILKETDTLYVLTTEMAGSRRKILSNLPPEVGLEMCRDFIKQQVMIQILITDMQKITAMHCFKNLRDKHENWIINLHFSKLKQHISEVGKLALDIDEPVEYKKLRKALFDTTGAVCFMPVSDFSEKDSKSEYFLKTLTSFFLYTLPRMSVLFEQEKRGQSESALKDDVYPRINLD